MNPSMGDIRDSESSMFSTDASIHSLIHSCEPWIDSPEDLVTCSKTGTFWEETLGNSRWTAKEPSGSKVLWVGGLGLGRLESVHSQCRLAGRTGSVTSLIARVAWIVTREASSTDSLLFFFLSLSVVFAGLKGDLAHPRESGFQGKGFERGGYGRPLSSVVFVARVWKPFCSEGAFFLGCSLGSFTYFVPRCLSLFISLSFFISLSVWCVSVPSQNT